MENLLDYLICALMGHNVSVRKWTSDVTKKRQWMLTFEDSVQIILDESDLHTIRYIYDVRTMDDDDRARYDKLFSLCV